MMEHRKRVSVIVALLISIAFAASCCSSFTKTAYSTLGTAAVTYDESMKAFAELYKKGYISETEKEMALNVAGKYYEIYQSAVLALETYQQVDGAVRKKKELEVQELLATLSEIGTRMVSLVAEFQARGE